jgi:flagellar biosynthetic protein FlhB
MPPNDDQEKTEEPTSKKIEDARKDGNVPKSQDFNSFITLIAALAVTYPFLTIIGERTTGLFRYYMEHIGQELDISTIMSIGIHSLFELMIMVLPIAIVVAIFGVVAALMQYGGFVFSTKPITPDLKKVDPIKGTKNLFSMKKLIEGVKITLKVAIVFAIAFFFLLEFIKELPEVATFDYEEQLLWLMEKAIILILVMLLLFMVLAIVDIAIVRFQYFKELRMSKQEVKDEMKQMEGDPQLKARIRQMQIQQASNRMMQDIPGADVVITNPTHYAVAVRYDQGKDVAPIIVAKGIDHLALKIKEIARESQVQVVENPPLARALYKDGEIGKVIPEALFKAIAEVLAYVYQANGKTLS